MRSAASIGRWNTRHPCWAIAAWLALARLLAELCAGENLPAGRRFVCARAPR
jgi:hypothetical protein